jgi:iron-regulated transporter 1
MLCASVVGSWIDRAPSRVTPLLVSIFTNHGAIIAAYLCWLVWPGSSGNSATDAQSHTYSTGKAILFGFTLLTDVVQDLSSIANKLSIERDCIPVLVGPATPNMSYSLTQVNAVLSRLDLACKLIAPSLLPLIISTFDSQKRWILLLMSITAVLWVLEIWCAKVIARENTQLHLVKQNLKELGTLQMHNVEIEPKFPIVGFYSWPQKAYRMFYGDPMTRLKSYFSMQIWPASFCIALFQMTILAYSSTLITYLFEVGFSINAVTIARASGSVMALLSTFITPLVVRYLRNRRQPSGGSEGKIIRTVGLWGVSFQLLCTVRLC